MGKWRRAGLRMIREKLAEILEQAVTEAQAKGQLPPAAMPEIALEHPQNPEHGDYASSLPLKLARAARMPPLDIAGIVVKLLPQIEGVDRVSVAAPGFINFYLTGEWLARQVDDILRAGQAYGNLDLGEGSKVQLEFVSVNPTGPIHVGHGRGAVL